MPSLFPSITPSNDEGPNRSFKLWQPGEPRPKAITAAVVVAIIVGVLMILSGIGMFQLQWDRSAANADEADYMDFVQRNVRILAVIDIIFGLAIVGISPKILSGNKRFRKILLVISLLAIFFLLAGWIMQFAPMGSAVLAVGLAVMLLLAYRPGAAQYFDHSTKDPSDTQGSASEVDKGNQ